MFSGDGGDNGAAGSGTLQLSVAVRPSVKVTAAVKSCVADQVRPSKALNAAEGHGLAVAPLLGVAPCGLLPVAGGHQGACAGLQGNPGCSVGLATPCGAGSGCGAVLSLAPGQSDSHCNVHRQGGIVSRSKVSSAGASFSPKRVIRAQNE